MKKSTFFSCIAIIILSIVLCMTCMGQSMLGATYSQIKQENPYASVEIRDVGTMITVEKDRCSWVHIIGTNDQYCSMSTLIPNDKTFLSGIIEYYNNNYVIISKTEWNEYLQGICISIKLRSTDAGTMYFVYQICKGD